MKDLSTFVSIASIVLLLGYVSYNELHNKTRIENSFSDETVALEHIEESGEPYLSAITFDLPIKITFADEPVPLNLPDVSERLDKEIQINSYLHSNTIFLMKRATRWFPQMEEIMRKYDIPSDFKYLPLIESNLLNVSSPRHAAGYWQILPESGKEFGLKITNDVDERYDPLKSTEAACKYLRKAHQKFDSWTMAAASYNRGMSGMDRAAENQKVKSYYDLYLTEETSRYVFRILAIKEIFEHPSKYGFRVNAKHLYKEEPLRYIKVTETIKDLIEFANDQGINYKLLKRHNPWLREERLTVKKGESYNIAIPVID